MNLREKMSKRGQCKIKYDFNSTLTPFSPFSKMIGTDPLVWIDPSKAAERRYAWLAKFPKVRQNGAKQIGEKA